MRYFWRPFAIGLAMTGSLTKSYADVGAVGPYTPPQSYLLGEDLAARVLRARSSDDPIWFEFTKNRHFHGTIYPEPLKTIGEFVGLDNSYVQLNRRRNYFVTF